MTCLKCNSSHLPNDNFCKSCGIALTFNSGYETKEKDSSDILLFVYLCLTIFFAIMQFVFQRYSSGYQDSSSRLLQGGM